MYFLNCVEGRIKHVRGTDPSRGPRVVHPWYTWLYGWSGMCRNGPLETMTAPIGTYFIQMDHREVAVLPWIIAGEANKEHPPFQRPAEAKNSGPGVGQQSLHTQAGTLGQGPASTATRQQQFGIWNIARWRIGVSDARPACHRIRDQF